MKLAWFVVGLAALAMPHDPAAAGPRHPRAVAPACAPQPAPFSLEGLLFNPPPEPNGCAPPVYQYGRYIGQDPDAFIRFQLKRDPSTGDSYDLIK